MSAFASGPEEIDQKVTSHFSDVFKNATGITWLVTDLYTEASFEWMNQKMEAFYDNNGDYFGVSREISAGSLPAEALKTINKKYDGNVVTQAIEFDDAQNKPNYYVLLKNPRSSIILKVSAEGEISIFSKTINH